MELLEERIRRDGVVKSEGVLKVDSFLNHQLDIDLFDAMGKEFKRLFADAPVTKILTIEASGIGIACVVARHFGVPVVFDATHSVQLPGGLGNASGGRRPVSAEQKTTEPAPKSDESGQISKWILQHPLHTACMISLFIALTCVVIESLGEPSIQFMAATAVICVVALIFLGIEVINFIIWFFKNC